MRIRWTEPAADDLTHICDYLEEHDSPATARRLALTIYEGVSSLLQFPRRGIAGSLSGHEVTEAIERGWDRISNGELLREAGAAGFDVLLTTDKRIRYQQNLKSRKIAIVVLGNSTWRVVRLHLDRIALAVSQATPGSYAEVDIPFT